MPFVEDDLAALDRAGFQAINALTLADGPTGTHSHPCKFVCMDVNTYWTKGEPVQQGLVVELIAARLADQLGVGPRGVIVNVSDEAIPAAGNPGCSTGLIFGSLDQNDMIPARDITKFIPSGILPPGSPDKGSWALVIAFQTWLGVGDSQVLLSVTTGRVASFDHGDCFGSAGTLASPTIVFTQFAGVTEAAAKTPPEIRAAVSKIEGVTDIQLVQACARMPTGPMWRSESTRRLTIANWLQHRRPLLRGIMDAWLST